MPPASYDRDFFYKMSGVCTEYFSDFTAVCDEINIRSDPEYGSLKKKKNDAEWNKALERQI